jgi:phosphatidylglycerol lysyltransferase
MTYHFEVVPKELIAMIMPELGRISSDWLARKRVREKRFSLGFFSEQYLRNFSTAVIREGDVAVAFANIWETDPKTELSIDLMRYSEAAPNGIMDYLFLQLMLWGKTAGYSTFNLGMAPFSGMENRPLAPLSSRLGAAIYAYGEHFYNFQGLREYKEKFHPQWQAKFLASPAGLSLPLVLANIATLVSGGLKGVVSK